MKIRLVVLFSFFIWGGVFGQIGFLDHVIIDDTNTPNGPTSVFAADIDNDGDMDMLSSSDDAKIAWYENLDGQGNFGSQQIIWTTSGATSVYASDLDGDGDIDVLSASNDRINWYENTDGQGNFGSAQLITIEAYEVTSVYASDIDGDGDIDVISAFEGGVSWYENLDGLGDFGSESTIKAGLGLTYINVYAADFDGDGDMDVISGREGGSLVHWFENRINESTYWDTHIISSNPGGGTSIVVSIGDIDGDGDIDVITGASSGLDVIGWYENTDGLGTFGTHQVIESTPDKVNSVYSVDVDNDGDMDVLSATESDNTIAWYENTNGQGTFGTQQIITTNAYLAKSVYASDIDGDGDMDVLSASYSDDKIAWYENTNGQGEFGIQQVITINASGAISNYASDLDGDGDLDVLCASFADNKIAWFENLNGQGDFGELKVITINALEANFVYASDIDGDGDIDVLSASTEDDKIAWYENLDGQGTFGGQQIISTTGVDPNFISVVDIDGDGDGDILTVSEQGYDVSWYENLDGLGNFGTQQIITTEVSSPRFASAADIDGDGDMDVLSASHNDDKIAWYENLDGQGTFGSQQIISTNENGASAVIATDIDGDGDMDILTTSKLSDNLSWYENTDGQGNFGSKILISASVDWAVAVSTADIDDDGDMDVFSTSQFDNKIAWYENLDGLGNFGTQQIITTDLIRASSLFVGDIDGDGDPDVISTSPSFNEVIWYENLDLLSNEINGIVQFDINSNGCDASDSSIVNVMVTTDNTTFQFSTFTLGSGLYQLFPDEGDFTTTMSFALPDYYTINPSSHISNFVGIGNTDVADFCIEPNQVIDDLNISLYPTSQARPGFDATYQLVYRNVGTTQLSGSIVVEFDESKFDMDSLTTSIPIASQNNNTITFDYFDFNPFGVRMIDLNFKVLPPPTVNIDDTLTFTATINPIAGDFTEEDNTFTFDQTVIGSYDPNDIRVLEGEEVLIENADQYLHYIIRFQNTGTASAINVRVENNLDDKLDWNTMQLESYSHPNRVEIKDGNEVSFIFDGIYLPDSTTNEPESNGFIAYKIKPKSDIAIGDIISSTADIYFDFNEAVVTNTVMTEIIDPVSTKENYQLRFSIFPIPTSGILSIQSKSTIAQIEIYDQLGQLVLTKSNANQIDLSNLNRGFYFCKVRDENGDAGIKKVVKE